MQLTLPFKARIPLFELTLVLVVVIIGVAEVYLYQISQEVEISHKSAMSRLDQLNGQINRDQQRFERERQELNKSLGQASDALNAANKRALDAEVENDRILKIFNNLRSEFTKEMPNLERSLAQDNLRMQEALKIKDEYLSIAERVETHVSGMQGALTNFADRKLSAEVFDRHNQEFKAWLAKEKERLDTERLTGKSREWQGMIRRDQMGLTNMELVVSKDLGRYVNEITRAYTNYVTNAFYIIYNIGKPLIGSLPAEINRSRQQSSILLKLASQAKGDANVIDTFLQPQWWHRHETRRPAILSFLKAQGELEAAFHTTPRSNAVAAIHIEPEKVKSEAENHDVALNQTNALAGLATETKTSFGFLSALYPLIIAQIGLSIFLMVAIYRRVVVEGLRFRLYESDTENKLAHVGQLAAWLAHEIRQPLTAINAWLWTLQRTVSEGMPEHMGAMAMRKEINRLDQIVKDFLRFTQPASPKIVPLQAETVLQEIQTLLAPQLERQHIQLELGPIAEARFHADPQQLKQVLMNLVTNAAESIEQESTMDGGRIIMRARRDKTQLKGESAEVVVIEVEDTGPGIPPEVQQRLFDPFFSTKEEGTGMGLPIAAKILETHGGELKFKTELGSGTTFRVVLPVLRK